MPERKPLTVGFLIILLIAQWVLPLVQFGPTLQDPEYADAFTRAKENNFPDSKETDHYPFSPLTRQQAAIRFDRFADLHNLPKTVTDCSFNDIAHLPLSTQQAILDGCAYGFFKGFKGGFVPNDPLSKAAAIVVLTRIVAPEKTFPDVKEFWVPYMEEAVRLHILHQPDHPYLMYPISRYELMLMLARTNNQLVTKSK